MPAFFSFIFVVFSLICMAQGSTGNPMLRAGSKTEYQPGKDDGLWHSELPDSLIIDSIVIHKALREMQAFSHQQLVKTYKIHLGLNPLGAKQVDGDCKTPEGLYQINSKNRVSTYHKSLGISYPNQNDMLEAKKTGRPPGRDVVIHGWPNGTVRFRTNLYQNDWTSGCIAVTNPEIDELFEHVNIGIPILITP